MGVSGEQRAGMCRGARGQGEARTNGPQQRAKSAACHACVLELFRRGDLGAVGGGAQFELDTSNILAVSIWRQVAAAEDVELRGPLHWRG